MPALPGTSQWIKMRGRPRLAGGFWGEKFRGRDLNDTQATTWVGTPAGHR